MSAAALRFRPINPSALVAEIARRSLDATHLGPALRVAFDGADGAAPGTWADKTSTLLRAAGRPCARVSMADWWRPASLRLEDGRHSPDGYRLSWFDYPAVAREVLTPCGPGGAATWLPSLWDPVRDRATRAAARPVAPGTVLLVDGPMLTGRGLDFELTVHLHLSESALRRATPTDEHWTVPALLAHEDLAEPDRRADVVARLEHADRPAIRLDPLP